MSENGFEDSQLDETPPEVYQRRRIVALVAFVLVLLLLIWGIVSLFRAIGGGNDSDKTAALATTSTSAEPFSDFSERATSSAEASESAKADASESAEANESAQASESASAEESANAEASESAEATAEASETASVEPTAVASTEAAVVACSASDLSVALTVDQNSYAAGQYPAMAITYTNTSGTPCIIGGSGQKIDVNITSGPAQVYNYAQCNAATSSEAAELAAGSSATKAISWDRKINALGCNTTSTIQPGYYWATATVNGVASTPTRIIVTG